MIYLTLLNLFFLIDGTPPEAASASSPAAWIAVLRERERTQGRDAWSWQELNEARAAVYDSRYATPTLTGWLKTSYVIYLRYAPVLVAIVMLAGLCFVWVKGRHLPWTTGVMAAILWIALIGLIHLPLQADRRAAAVIKTAGIMLRQGNGLSYAWTLYQDKPIALASGVEAEWLAERANGWVQIRLTDGTRGWIPKDTVYLIGP